MIPQTGEIACPPADPSRQPASPPARPLARSLASLPPSNLVTLHGPVLRASVTGASSSVLPAARPPPFSSSDQHRHRRHPWPSVCASANGGETTDQRHPRSQNARPCTTHAHTRTRTHPAVQRDTASCCTCTVCGWVCVRVCVCVRTRSEAAVRRLLTRPLFLFDGSRRR